MATDMSPRAVALRLEELRAMWTPDDERSARARLEDPAGLPRPRTFAQAVALRLAELRALCDLTDYLHLASRDASSSASDE
jgi:hypothetical protein